MGQRAQMKLLSPLQVGPLTVVNRLVSTAHGAFLDFYRPGVSGDRYVAYQERRAAGGCGLIVLQPVHAHPSSHALGHYTYERDDLAGKLTQMADAIHRHSGRVLLQIMHFGAQFNSDARGDLEPLWAFSPITTLDGEVAHEMTGAEIEEVITGFVQTAVLAVESGLDGVELHATHGYLIQQSFSAWANRRTDRWGEPLAFASALIDQTREAIGPDKVLGIRLCVDDFMPVQRGGVGVDRLLEIGAQLVRRGGLDYINHSEGARASDYARSIGNYRHPNGEWLPLARRLREEIGAAIPVIGVGKIMTPDLAEQALRDGDCDLVAMTRAQIADPELGRKLAEGRAAEIRPCLAANQGCVDRMQGGLPITCFHNPDVGREHRLAPLQLAAQPRRVLVVGAGPAGLKAAEIAARRGHQVTLCDAGAQPGGRLLAVRSLGAAAELLASVDWILHELEALSVSLRLRTTVDQALLAELRPEAVVLATGSRPAVQMLAPADGSLPVISVDDAARSRVFGERVSLAGERVLLVDVRGNQETALIAEHLVAERAVLTIATPFLSWGPFVGFTHRKDFLEVLGQAGAEIQTSTLFAGVDGGVVTLRDAHRRLQAQRRFDIIVAGVPGSADTSLAGAVESLGVALHLAGDCVAPRTAMHAFREGDAAGRAV